MDKRSACDYTLAFSDSQRLHLLRNKLSRAHLSLESITDIISGFKSLMKGLLPAEGEIYHHLEMASTQIKGHTRRSISINNRSSSIAELVCSLILNFSLRDAKDPVVIQTTSTPQPRIVIYHQPRNAG